jgi:hypothetical protein
MRKPQTLTETGSSRWIQSMFLAPSKLEGGSADSLRDVSSCCCGLLLPSVMQWASFLLRWLVFRTSGARPNQNGKPLGV